MPLEINYDGLPEGLRGGARRWIENGIQPGDFLSAVISNDLREACGRADAENQVLLLSIVSWWYNEAPFGSWGNLAKAQNWAALKGREFV